MLMSRALVVRSIDFIMTLSFGVIGELACLSGLKFKIAFRILLAIDGRDRMSIARQLRVAFTNTASLHTSLSAILSQHMECVPCILLEDVE